MTRPDDIPEDVWDAAFHLMDAHCVDAMDGDDLEQSVHIAIARAILAERERCAKTAEEIGDAYGEDEAGWAECADCIATAIRDPKD